MIKMLKHLIAAAALTAALVAVPAPANAVGGCVTHNEYDSLEWGLSTDQVQNRFETNGWLIGVGDNFFRRGYDACWANDRKVVIWYALDNGLSDHWDIRDQ